MRFLERDLTGAVFKVILKDSVIYLDLALFIQKEIHSFTAYMVETFCWMARIDLRFAIAPVSRYVELCNVPRPVISIERSKFKV